VDQITGRLGVDPSHPIRPPGDVEVTAGVAEVDQERLG
jgi:hypothetical protein